MILATNKKAKFDYHILESFQAGLSLSGKMVKQIRSQRVTLQGAFVVYQNNKLEIIGLGNDKTRENVALLLKKREVSEISTRVKEKGISCIVLNLKTVGRWLKAEVAVVKGKKNFDKRETIKKRDIEREVAREL